MTEVIWNVFYLSCFMLHSTFLLFLLKTVFFSFFILKNINDISTNKVNHQMFSTMLGQLCGRVTTY